MAKSSKLVSNLKAADRRRRRRTFDRMDAPQGSGGTGNVTGNGFSDSPNRSTDFAGVDVAGMLIDSALRAANQSSQVRDSTIIAALRAISSGHPPQGVAGSVYADMVSELDQAHVGRSDRQKCASELLEIALPNTSPDSSRQLIAYLSLIAS